MEMKNLTFKVARTVSIAIFLLQTETISAQATVQQWFQKFQGWLNPILNLVVAICLTVSFVGLIVSLASKSQDVKTKAIYFGLALLLWAAKAVIFSDLGGIIL